MATVVEGVGVVAVKEGVGVASTMEVVTVAAGGGTAGRAQKEVGGGEEVAQEEVGEGQGEGLQWQSARRARSLPWSFTTKDVLLASCKFRAAVSLTSQIIPSLLTFWSSCLTPTSSLS